MDLDKRMDGVVKPSRDGRDKERTRKAREMIEKYVKESIIEELITKAQAYGESLTVCREIQQKFENRPVTKYYYPYIEQQIAICSGAMPKSLQVFNQLGKVMFLNRNNMLSMYDISNPENDTPAQVNLGTRPPLKHYDIIDMVCD